MSDALAVKRKLDEVDMKRMQIPAEYWFMRVDHVSDKVRPRVERFLGMIEEAIAKGTGLLIHGSPGVGKTTIAALIAKEARSRRRTVLFTRIWQLREMIRSKVFFDDDASMMDRAMEVDVLILDDFRELDIKERFLGATDIEQLSRTRTSNGKLTVITTRISSADLQLSIDARLSEFMMLLHVEGPNMYEENIQKQEDHFLGE